MIKVKGNNFKNLLKIFGLIIEVKDDVFKSPNIFHDKIYLLKDVTILIINRFSKCSLFYNTSILININRFSIRTLKGKIIFSLLIPSIEII
jgi:hypothetical protein